METPPRAWGRLAGLGYETHCDGNTPTGVGKTNPRASANSTRWKHPHGRGEDQRRRLGKTPPQETPPRAWGRPLDLLDWMLEAGNTPTGVGKTLSVKSPIKGLWKHPHGRGEDWWKQWKELVFMETPPRAWGRLSSITWMQQVFGNTPTGVGKTHRGTGGMG